MKSDTVVATNIDELLEQIREYNPGCDEQRIRQAYDMAAELHKDQRRDSGEPYIIHPLAVASILASLRMDDTTIMAGLLHDVVEDTDMTLEDITKLYGAEMAVLLDGVTKLSKLAFRSKQERQVENLRKMFLAMSKDIRIIIVKLADRLHNMRTLSSHHSELRKKEIALETQEIFAPLAHRLGIYKIKWELEDLCLRYLEPEAYNNLVEQITMKRDEREAFLNEVCEMIQKNLKDAKITAEISGRPKNFYSIYRKMLRQNKNLNEIYDIHAVRVLVDNVRNCYGALGVVHTLWKPMPGRFKDYIAMPKANMYQSLHTTVIGPAGRPVEVQIRTYEMHQVAEYGIAAHWKYKEGKVDLDTSSAAREVDNRLAWMRQMLDWQKEVSDAKEFVENVKGDLFGDQSVFVFTPAGDVIELPYGATPIDFAYRVHTQVGHQCVGAKVDGRIVQLDTTLKNGNIVEVLTTRGTGPSRDWLKIAKTNQAKNKIRQWFRKEGRDEFSVQKGKSILEKEAAKNNIDVGALFKNERLNELIKRTNFVSAEDMYVALAEGAITAIGIINKIKEDNNLRKALLPEQEPAAAGIGTRKPRPFSETDATHDKGVWVKGEADLMVRIANCCQPLPGDAIQGYITRGRGVSIHKEDCPNLRYYREHEPERLVDVQWDNENTGVFQAELEVLAMDRDSLGVNVMSAIAETKTRINSISFDVDADKVCHGWVRMEINNLNQLEYIINKLRKIRGVTDVRRKSRGDSKSKQ